MNTRTLSIRFAAVMGALVAALAMGAPAALAGGATVVVDTAGPTATSCGTYTGKPAVTDLAAALTAATGGTVVICPGSYSIAGVTINGAHSLTIKQAVPGAENAPHITISSGVAGLWIKSSTNVIVDGLLIDSTGIASGSYVSVYYYNSSGIVRNCVLLGAAAHSVSFATADVTPVKGTITNNTILGYAQGISAFGPAKLTISGNFLDGTDGGRLSMTGQTGIFFSGASSVMDLSGSISKNTLINNFEAMTIEESGKVTMTGNLISSSSIGIMVRTYGSRHNADGNKIIGNTFLAIPASGAGIFLDDEDTSAPLATIHGMSISKNTFHNTQFKLSGDTTAGIYLTQANTTPGLISATVSGNSFTGFAISPSTYYIFYATGGPVVTGSGNAHTP